MSLLRTYLAAVLVLTTAPTFAQDAPDPSAPAPAMPQATASASLTLTIESAGDIERRVVTYLCDTGQTMSVQYVNAAPNFLAIVPVNDQNLVFASALSASGARYVSGPYEWWTRRDEARLSDLTLGEDADPLATCTEASNTP